MKLAAIVFAAALVACLAGIWIGRSTAPVEPQEECLYAAVSAYPALPVSQSPLDSVRECRGLSGPQKEAIREMVSRFVTSALTKSTKEG